MTRIINSKNLSEIVDMSNIKFETINEDKKVKLK